MLVIDSVETPGYHHPVATATVARCCLMPLDALVAQPLDDLTVARKPANYLRSLRDQEPDGPS